LKASDIDLGGFWAPPDKSFSAAGSGSVVEGKFEIIVYTEKSPFDFLSNAQMRDIPALHLTGAGGIGTLFDAFNSNLNSGRITQLTFEAYEYVRGAHVDSKQIPFSDSWGITCTALRPQLFRVWGEKNMEIPKQTFSSSDYEITLESINPKFESHLESTQRYTQLVTFKTKEPISIGQFLLECASVATALLKICWQQRIGPEVMSAVSEGRICEIFATYLPENGNEKALNGNRALIYFDQMDWGKWFDFCKEHRNTALLLADLVSGGTGYLQNQLLNVCIVLEDLARREFDFPESLATPQSEWEKARNAAILAAAPYGLRRLVKTKLPKSYGKTLGTITNYVRMLDAELDLEFQAPEDVGLALVDARNPVAHTSESHDDLQEMAVLLRGATALATLGIFLNVFGHEVARAAVPKLSSSLDELDTIASSIKNRET
jgi:hypothetical protein